MFLRELKLKNPISNFCIFIIRLYQKYISYLLGPRCRFYPSCSHYCLECFNKFSINKALWYSSVRIIKCQPFHPGGMDPVPNSGEE